MTSPFYIGSTLCNGPVEINNKTTIGKNHKHVEKAIRRKVMPGFPVKSAFLSIHEIEEYFSGDRITCLLCGKSFKALCSHLSLIHKVSADDYKQNYGLPYKAGLTSSDTREKKSESMKNPSQLLRLATYRERQKATGVTRKGSRTSALKLMKTAENRALSPFYSRTYTEEDGDAILSYMERNDCSLSAAIRATNIMDRSTFADVVARFPGLNYAARMRNTAKGKRNPIAKNPEAISRIRDLHAHGKSFKEIGELIGIHEEYASLLARRNA